MIIWPTRIAIIPLWFQTLMTVLLVLAGLSCSLVRETREPQGRPPTPGETAAGRFTLSNGRIEAAIMTPDQLGSVYRGPRYESGGVVLQVTLDGRHTFLGEQGQREQFDSFGLIEEMGIADAIGYEQAEIGGEFLKPGVGLLKRDSDPHYRFFKQYPMAASFPWSVTITSREAIFTQIGQPWQGIAYHYEKRVQLDPREPVLSIVHIFTNTGRKPIVTDQYCHNFFRFDDAPPGPEYKVIPDFTPAAERDVPEFRIDGKDLTLRNMLDHPVFIKLQGQNPAARSHSLRVRHRGNGLEVQVEGDFPLDTLACYADPMSICPEPFYAINVQPGETAHWTRTYTFIAHKKTDDPG